MPPAEVLYLHPYGHLNDLVIPAGAITCLNAVRAPKLGRYAFEVSDDEIRAARVVAMDLHWALAITGFEPMVHHVRAINPAARIVVGGVTAGHYALDLLERFPIDFVVRGDSEVSFARLVEALLEGRRVDGIPNVFQRGTGLPPFQRMTEAEFDATDCLTADWFPTYMRVSTWDAVAFPQGRTIPVSRGCSFACPECYGSYASTFGRGFLMRSPEGVVAILRRAEQMRLRNIRLFVAKPPPTRLSALIRALAAAGPFRFESSVGFYLCTPPAPDELRALDAAFDKQVAISMIPPEEHVPVLKPKRLAIEKRAWFQVAEQVHQSERLLLDAWTTTRGKFERTRDAFAACAPGAPDSAGPRVKVSFGAVWSVTRPMDTGEKHRFDTVREAVLPVWTFYLANLLSPALRHLLEPFAFLDELALDPDTLTRPSGALGPFFDLAMASWKQHRLPTLPGLSFSLLPVGPTARMAPRPGDVRLKGQLARVEVPATTSNLDSLDTLEAAHDAAGVRLTGINSRIGDARHLAFLPRIPGLPAIDAAWLHQVGAHGLIAVPLPENGSRTGSERPLRVDVLLRAQEALVAVSSTGGEVVGRGRADLCYFQQR